MLLSNDEEYYSGMGKQYKNGFSILCKLMIFQMFSICH